MFRHDTVLYIPVYNKSVANKLPSQHNQTTANADKTKPNTSVTSLAAASMSSQSITSTSLMTVVSLSTPVALTSAVSIPTSVKALSTVPIVYHCQLQLHHRHQLDQC